MLKSALEGRSLGLFEMPAVSCLSSTFGSHQVLEFTELVLSHDAHARVLTVTLSREARLNSLSEVMGNEILKLCEVLSGEPADGDVRCVVVTGAGRVYSTGRDLKESAAHSEEDGRRYLKLAFASANAFSTLPMPVIAAINGPCYGWGLESALACDIRLTTKGATLCFPEARLGIFPGAGGLARLTKMVPLSTAKLLVLTARSVRGEEALQCGLVDVVYEDADALRVAAAAMAAEMTANAPLGVRAAKRLFDQVQYLPLFDALERSRMPRIALNATRDFKEGVQAFADKRAPVFRGR